MVQPHQLVPWMPHGLKNRNAVWQGVIKKDFGDVRMCVIYTDDIIIGTQNEEGVSDQVFIVVGDEY